MGGNLNLFDELKNTLLKNSKYSEQNTENPKLLRNIVIEDALNMNKELLHTLLSNPNLKKHFFTDVDGVLVFDKNKFTWTIENKEFLPDSYTRFKQKIGLIDSNERFISSNNDVVLSFPYKDCVLEGGQTREEQKKDEVFFNEILAPEDVDCLLSRKVMTKAQKYTSDGIKIIDTFNSNDNLIIRGNNLLVLGSLRKRYRQKVNLIYIDPPFNTGNDSFNYNDSFTRSSWLTFMKNRLELARELLTNDGNIFIHIDIHQSHYLKVICDEIFGNDNFVEEIIWSYGSPSGGRAASAKPVNVHDYILHYAKSYPYRKQNKVYVPYSEKYIKDWFKYKDDDGRIYQKRQRGRDENGQVVWERQYLDESKGVPLSTVWSDIKQVYADPRAYKKGKTSDVEVIKEFSGGQKPEALIKRIMEMATDQGDLFLDFHLGTGTSIAVAHKMGRRYIGVEQLDSQIEIIKRRLLKVINGDTAGISKNIQWQGGGAFVYCELKALNQQFIDKICNADSDVQLVALFNIVSHSKFISTKVNPKTLDSSVESFEQLSFENKRKLLFQLLDLNMLYVNYSDIDDDEYDISDSDKEFNRSFYGD